MIDKSALYTQKQDEARRWSNGAGLIGNHRLRSIISTAISRPDSAGRSAKFRHACSIAFLPAYRYSTAR